MKDKIIGVIIKIWTISTIIGFFYGAGIFVTALFLGDFEDAINIVNKYSFFHKIIISVISGAIFIWLSKITTFLFRKFVLNK